MGGEMKPGGRGLKSWAQRHLNVGFAVGFLFVLLTYLVVSWQLAVTAPGGKRILNSPPFRSLRGAGAALFRSCTARTPITVSSVS